MREQRTVNRGGSGEQDHHHEDFRFHRTSKHDLSVTITMDDPKLYTKPFLIGQTYFRWVPNQQIDDFTCIPSEVQQYLKEMGDPAGDPTLTR